MNHVDIKPYTRQFLRGNAWRLVLAVLQIICTVAANMLITWLIQQIVDVTAGADTGFSIMQLLMLSLMTTGLIALAHLFAYHAEPAFAAGAIGRYKEYVFEKLSRKNIGAFSGENTSLYLSALSNDAAAIENNYLKRILYIVQQCVMFAAALCMMLWYSPLLTAVSIGLSVLPVVVSLAAGSRIADAEKAVSSRNEEYMSTLCDSLSGFSVVKSFRAEKQICRIFMEKVREVSLAKERREKVIIIVQMLSSVAGVIVQLGVFIVGAYLATKGMGVTGGVVMAFVQMMNYVLAPIGAVPEFVAQSRAARALIRKLAEALDQNVRDEGSVHKSELERGIELRSLSFSYEEDKPVLKDIDFFFEQGRSYAVVGASGSGKSTLLSLLMAARHDYGGSILYDDIDLKAISSESLYEMVSVVQQNVFIFNASIRDNITMFSSFPREEVDRAIELSGLSALIAGRGEGHLCGENGSALSGGEKQRISIARSLLKKSRVLLVDEATASLDAQTAHQVSDAILNLTGLTRIVVTHSLDAALLSRYDCVLTLKNGAIEEAGSFADLMEKKGYFYSLYTVSQ